MKPQDAPIDVMDTGSSRPGFTARVGGALLWTQLLRIVEVGTSALFLVFVIRRLGPTEYGIFGVIISVTAVGNMISMFGFADTLNKHASEFASDGRHDAIAAMARRIIGVGFLLASLCCALLWVFREQIGRALQHPGMSGLYPIIAVLVISQTLFALLSALNIGLWRARTVFVITGLVNILSATGAIWLVYAGKATGAAAASAAALAFLLGMVAFVIVSRRWLFTRPAPQTETAPIWRFAASAWLVRLSAFSMGSNIVVILICWLLGSQREVAFFNCAFVPLSRLQALILGWSVSVLPSLAELRAKLGVSSMVLPYRIYIKLSAAIAAPTLIFLAWYSDPLVIGLFGREFARAAVSLRIYAILSLVALLASSGLTTMLLYSLGKHKVVGYMRAGTAVMHLGLSCWLILRYGAVGAIIGIGLAAVVAACLELALTPATMRRGYPIGFIAKAIIVSGGCVAAFSLLRPGTIPELLGGGLAYLAVYALLLARWKPLDDDERKILGRDPTVVRILRAFGV